MQNNKLGKIKVDTDKRPRARFNLSYDVNTTSDWGFGQPIVSRFMYPNTKNVVQVEELVRLAPMLAPTFGRVVSKQYHQFVDIEDIFPPFASFMAGEPYNGVSSYVPKLVPRIPLALLSSFVLAGAKLTPYVGQSSDSDSRVLATMYRYTATNASLVRSVVMGALGIVDSSDFTPNVSGAFAFTSNVTCPSFRLDKLLDSDTLTWFSGLENSHGSLSPIALPLGNAGGELTPADDADYVSLESADIVYPRVFDFGGNLGSRVCYLAFRLSDFGRRLRKVLLGNGYQIDFQSREVVSLLPLMATYKAYYDLFGLTAHSNYQQTWLSRYSASISARGNSYIDAISLLTLPEGLTTGSNLLKCFILSLADLWFTDSQDYISAHQSTTTFSSSPDGVNNPDKFISVNGDVSNIQLMSNVDDASKRYKDAAITANPFSQLDVELLKRLYVWSNVNSVAGKQIADALRAQGFGSYVDSCKSNFIGYSEQMINISDVVSSADTYKRDGDSRDGAVLGEYGGRGIGYNDAKPLTFETDKFGYWIGLYFIVPKSGYNQGLDQTLVDTERFDFYQSRFDGLGYQMSTDSVVVGGVDFYDVQYNVNKDPFGLIPRYTEWKVQKNISNGDFSLRSLRNQYLPYCLDKELPVGERLVEFHGENADQHEIFYYLTKAFIRYNLPDAGDIWRFLGRYPWIGLYDRIFANFNEDDIYKRVSEFYGPDYDSKAVSIRSDDNFLVHFIVNQQSYAPMLPVEDVFGTDDDGSFDSSIDKA